MKVDYVDHMGSDLLVVNAARVSFHKESELEKIYIDEEVSLYNEDTKEFELSNIRVCVGRKLSDADNKLLRYLARNNHWTPFAHPQITLRIKAPIFVRTQLFKHKVGFTENEVSRRYVDDKPEFYWPILRQRPTDGAKQGSRDEFPVQLELCERAVWGAYETAQAAYKILLEQGVAPEQARMVLPQSMYTEWYWTGSLAAYARVCKQRLDPHAQKETRDIAQMISDIIKPLFPVSWEVLIGESV